MNLVIVVVATPARARCAHVTSAAVSLLSVVARAMCMTSINTAKTHIHVPLVR